jgi:hypothetical protein
MTDLDLKSPAPCTSCKGLGSRTSPGFRSQAGHYYPERTDPCHACMGAGHFPGIDIPAIVELVMTGKGDKRRFRKSWPSRMSPWGNKNVTERRAYFIWRLARFHGGADVTMPMTAMDATAGDPFKTALDALSDVVAKKVFGSDMAAAHRWGSVLGFSRGPTPEGLPASAYVGGPVVTEGIKPVFEALELE